MTIRPVVELACSRANITLQPTIETNSIVLMKQLARSGTAVTFLNALDVGEDIARGELAYLPLQDFQVRPLTLRLAIRARGGLDAFPSLVAEELRKALPLWQSKWQTAPTDADRASQ